MFRGPRTSEASGQLNVTLHARTALLRILARSSLLSSHLCREAFAALKPTVALQLGRVGKEHSSCADLDDASSASRISLDWHLQLRFSGRARKHLEPNLNGLVEVDTKLIADNIDNAWLSTWQTEQQTSNCM